MTDLTLEVHPLGSPHRNVDIPDQSLAAFLLDAVEIDDGRIALTDAATGREMTFGALRMLVDSFATGLARMVAPTEVVALLGAQLDGLRRWVSRSAARRAHRQSGECPGNRG